MPTFFECATCQRLYSQHSLPIHQKTCENAMTSKKENDVKKRQSSLTKTGKLKIVEQQQQQRPRTQSLSRAISMENSFENYGHRICFVCGKRFDADSIEAHKTHCLEEWSKYASAHSSRFHFYKPKMLEIPTIDGTIDVARENLRASQSSRNCQLVRCKRCNAKIPFQHAHFHQCARFEPSIEFFF